MEIAEASEVEVVTAGEDSGETAEAEGEEVADSEEEDVEDLLTLSRAPTREASLPSKERRSLSEFFN